MVDVSVGWGVCRGYGEGFGIVVVDELYIGVCDQLGEVIEFEVGGKFVSIKMSNMKSMLILMTV